MTDKPYTGDPFEPLRQLYEETGNPVYPWHVIAMLAYGRPENKYNYPNWVLDYIGKAAGEMIGMFGEAISKPPDNEAVRETLIRALGFTSERGVSAAVGKFGKRTRDLTLGNAVAARLQNGTCLTEADAYKDVAVDFGAAWNRELSESTVRRAYQVYKEATKQ